MKFFDRVKLGFRQFVKLTLNDLPRWNGGVLGSNTGRSMSIQADPYGSLTGWAFFATTKVAKNVAQLEPELYELGLKGDLEEIFDHPFLSALYRANVIMTKRDLLKITAMFLYIWGSAPWYIELARDRKTILSIWPMRPDFLKIKQDESGKIINYSYTVGGKTIDYKTDEVLNIREPNPANPIYGQSTLFSASLEIDSDIASAVWNKYLLENGAAPGGVLETDGEISDEKFERLKADWESKYGGAQNAGKVAILELGLKYAKVSATPAELDFINSRNFNRDTILTLLGIPTSLINDTANRANAETAERVFLRDTIDPMMRLITDSISEFLLPRYGDNLWLSYTSPLTLDTESKRLDNMAGVNVWKTPNEARLDYDLPAMDGGDYIYGQFSQVPLIGDALPDNFDDLPEDQKVMVMKKAKDKISKMDGQKMRVITKAHLPKKHLQIKKAILARTHIKRKAIERITEIATEAVKKALNGNKIILKGIKSVEKKVEDDPNGGLPEPVALERKAYLGKLPKLMRRFKGKMRKVFDAVEEEVMSNLDGAGDPKSIYDMDTKGIDLAKKEIATKGFIEKVLFDRKKMISVIVKFAKPEAEANLTEGGKDVAKLMGVDYEDLVARPETVKYIDEKPLFFAESVSDTTLIALQDTLKDALSNGEGRGEIQDRISEVFNIARGFRTETIARTEVGSALNFGRNGEMQVQGVEKKQWISIFSNSRDDHMEAHGDIVGINEKFDVGGEDLDYPQDPNGSPANVINCQCNSSPVFD